ncbi:RNA ligase-domain-containing protein [Radiomyces spectabilis]|uniref:RNA ligase-domain-containing protein n=1 Tax=Radiomyces spectabilis TaxID=64574 RepID=UPI00221FC2BE|nr:RNA ligase-domain-containing protein [Radiomyces spectabilis]KAI8379621.1 RNA ligase-domain-containing protein [Radiomyces spectabilis]
MNHLSIPLLNIKHVEDHHVINRLYELVEKEPRKLRKKTCNVNGQPWTSWTMQEHIYKKQPDCYPTQARGLFTTTVDDQYRIMVRGYDKFFNIGETKITQWEDLEKETVGPYEVTAKENGCIIFIAAASPDAVVVTSKHTIPDPKDDANAHGGVGYRWLLQHLNSVNKSESELAQWLYQHQLTLVAELCDDDFEQHILPYTKNERGLYLHGINYNTSKLHTLPSDTVRSVAKELGVHPIDYEVLPNLEAVKTLSDTVQKSGLYRNREVEGLVVKDGVVSTRDRPLRCHYEKTNYYVAWLQERVKDHPEWFIEFKQNKGIIDVRRRFEQFWEQGNLTLHSEEQ